MSKLNKIKKKLEELNIKYEYTESEANYISVAMGDIVFWDKDKNQYSLGEHSGSGGKTVKGIMTNGKDFKSDWANQTRIVEWLEKNKDRF